jgi:hypothetical protein
LVDALAAFSAGAYVASGEQLVTEASASSTLDAGLAATSTTGLVDMVDALKQFDANGQAIGGGALSVAGTTAVTLKGYTPDKKDIDILAASK